LVVKGWTNRAIGEYIQISEHTAKFHIGNIARKWGVSTRTEMAVEALKRGWA
jgi:DNA-binding NarL/FixJ family response regulator